MKILLVGDWHSSVHEEPAFRALQELGHEVGRFAWHGYFDAGQRALPFRLYRRAQYKYLFGSCLRRLNADLIEQAAAMQPGLVFIYRGTHVLPQTIRRLRESVPGVVVAGYNNDDPFAPNQPRWLWRHFIACLPEYDAALAYRRHNMAEFSRHGAKRVYLLRSWFVPEFNHPVQLSADDHARFDTDVVFVGHHEDDGRLQMLERLAGSGLRLRLFGPAGWERVIADSPLLKALGPIRPVWGEDYNKALCGAKVALCFLSKLNRDTYTRRCFEIPATGTLLLSEYSDDLAGLFKEGSEADYFRSPEELLVKARLYVDDASLRERVAAAGLERVHADGHDVKSRMRDMLSWLSSHCPTLKASDA